MEKFTQAVSAQRPHAAQYDPRSFFKWQHCCVRSCMELAKLKLSDDIRNSGIFHGALIGIALIAYFWIAWLFDFLHIPELRVLNILIQIAGIYFALRQFKRTHGDTLNYFRP